MKKSAPETNYCAHAVDDLKKLHPKLAPSIERETVSVLLKGLSNSVKFRIPDYGRILQRKKGDTIGSTIERYCHGFRLPYPNVALEWDVPDCESLAYPGSGYDFEQDSGYDAVLCLASEEKVEDRHVVVMYLMCRAFSPEGKAWVPLNFGAVIYPEGAGVRIFAQTNSGKTTGENSAVARADVIGEVSALVEFVAALACSNSIAADAPPPNPKLNAKRKKAGKTPFFSYKVLTIASQGSPTAGRPQGGSHGSPRVHLRRGHIRRLPERTVWVNACVVGDKSKGFIHKDYNVT